METDKAWDKVAAYLIGIGIAVFAGVAKFCHDSMRAGMWNWRLLLGRAVVAAFVGFMFFEISQQMETRWTWVACGLGGWLGADGITLLHLYLKSRLRLPGDTAQIINQAAPPARKEQPE